MKRQEVLGIAERRRARRVQTEGLLFAVDLDGAEVLSVLDFSSGGFQVESARPRTMGDRHRFTLKAGIGGRAIEIVRARVTHCRSVTAGDGRTMFRIGYAFVSEETP